MQSSPVLLAAGVVGALLFAVAAVSATSPPAPDPCANNYFMPLPSTLTCFNTAVIQLAPNGLVMSYSPATNANPAVTQFVAAAYSRYNRDLLFGRNSGTQPKPDVVFRNSIFEDKINGSVQTVTPTPFLGLGDSDVYPFTITVDDQTMTPSPAALGQADVDESYTLSLTALATTGGFLHAKSVWGLVRGLETLSQAIQWSRYQGVSGWYVYDAPLLVVDTPRFPWRGLLLDTARQYHPVSHILHVLDMMSYVKLNVLHWHLSDAESFPLASALHPELAQHAAYSPNATYSAQNISTVIAYALERGIRVVPEVDTPGHTAALGQAYPQVIANCYAYETTSSSLNEGHLAWPAWDSVALDITQQDVIRPVVSGILQELVGVYGDPYFHIGGDEVKTSCWSHVPSMVQYMLAHKLYTNNTATGKVTYLWQNLTDAYELWVQQLMYDSGRTSIVWEEAFNNSMAGPGKALLPSTTVHVWQSTQMLDQAVNAGFNVINSYGWYVDRQNPTCSSNNLTDPTQGCPTMWMWEWTWHTMYAVDPVQFLSNPSPANIAKILGGEIASFGESVDPINFDARVWTRAPPIAERLWSPASVTSIYSAQQRFSALRCLWARRGVRMGPSVPAYCSVDDNYGFAPLPPPSPQPCPVPVPENTGTDYKPVATAFIVLFVLSAVSNCFLFALYRRASTSGTAVNTEYQRGL